MKLPVLNFAVRHPIFSISLVSAVLGSCVIARNYFKADDRTPVSLTGVHHLGSDYFINTFYVNKDIGGNAGEGGGGGGTVCCLTLPEKWYPGLKADVRWEVRHIVRSSDPGLPETAEEVGMYRAQVPVEAYTEPETFWVHFFPQGRVRIVVSPIGFNGPQHPIKWGDPTASQKATVGSVVKTMFTPEEIAETEREIARDKKKYGDWR